MASGSAPFSSKWIAVDFRAPAEDVRFCCSARTASSEARNNVYPCPRARNFTRESVWPWFCSKLRGRRAYWAEACDGETVPAARRTGGSALVAIWGTASPTRAINNWAISLCAIVRLCPPPKLVVITRTYVPPPKNHCYGNARFPHRITNQLALIAGRPPTSIL